VSTEDFEKAKKDFSKLQKRVITDKNGNRRTVYIKVGEKLDDSTHSYKEKEKTPQYYKNIAYLDKQGLAEKQFSEKDLQQARKIYGEKGVNLKETKESFKINPSKQSKKELYEAINKKYGTSFKVGDIDELEDDEFRKELTEDDIKNIVEDEKEQKIEKRSMSSVSQLWGGGMMIAGYVNGKKRINKIKGKDADIVSKHKDKDEVDAIYKKLLIDEFDPEIDKHLKKTKEEILKEQK